MGSTYLSLYYHLVFSTKNREAMIDPSWRSRLHEYMAGTINGLKGIPLAINGVEDHVHLLVRLKATHCLANVLRELKMASSVWVHEKIGLGSFAWQEGYAAFTVSASSTDGVKRYIANQFEQHRLRTFRKELVEMLKKAGVEYDPQYLE